MPSKNVLELVKKIGLNDYEAKAFTSLLEFESLSAVDISEKSGIPRPRVYDILDSLGKKGLVVSMPSRPVKFRALELQNGFENLKKTREDAFRMEIGALDSINQDLSKLIKNKASLNESTGDGAWLLNGQKAIYSKLDSLFLNATKEIIISSHAEGLENKLKALKGNLEGALKKGVNVKLITNKQNNSLLEKHGLSKAKLSVNDRVHRIALIDNNQAMLFLSNQLSNKEDKAILIESPELASFLKQKIS